MIDLNISRRTLQRWLEDLSIESLEFENHLRVFLTITQVQQLRNYGLVMKTRSQRLITRYIDAYTTGNEKRMARIIEEAIQFKSKSKGESNVSITEELESSSPE